MMYKLAMLEKIAALEKLAEQAYLDGYEYGYMLAKLAGGDSLKAKDVVKQMLLRGDLTKEEAADVLSRLGLLDKLDYYAHRYPYAAAGIGLGTGLGLAGAGYGLYNLLDED